MDLSARRLLEEGAVAGPVLGIDTGGPVASLGVVADGRIRAAFVRSTISHCAGLPEAVAEVMDAAGVALSELSAIAIAVGPGSFTGLRVGLSYAKGLAVARNIAIAGVSSLDALALCAGSALREGASVYPIIDARRGEVYTGLYRFVADALKRASGDLVVPLTRLAAEIGGEVTLVGDTVAERARSLLAANGCQAVVFGGAELHLRGSFVAAIGAAKVARKEADVAATLEPLYVRPPDAASSSTALKSGEDINGTPRGRTHPAIPRA
ncbi:MAG TPA: tRNA (adenosine(37)-N6)-threonylcarbamoyltransferase complex dimerization subunit type 1 TsaB [Candidatus Binataceae bacterium]|nr:tRNA (adenosine(37)-N6)-threonylcarbamoyltransferase complex dimerization subunit type 1 TsaB [Candidatus Binataceae bacterium]